MNQQPVQALTVPAYEILFTPPPELAKPVVVVSKAMAEIIGQSVVTAMGYGEIDSAEMFAEVGRRLNDLQKSRNAIEQTRLKLGQPFRKENDRIKTEADRVIFPADQAILHYNKLMSAWDFKQQEKIRAARAEQERLTREAQAVTAAATRELAKAKTEEEFAPAAEHFDRALAVQQQAAVAAVSVPQEAKAAGTRKIETPVIDSIDLAKLPMTYHLADEKKIRAHIKDGTITPATPGVRFHMETSFSGSGR